MRLVNVKNDSSVPATFTRGLPNRLFRANRKQTHVELTIALPGLLGMDGILTG